MADEIGMMEAIYSQRQIARYRRDPVSREDIETIIDAAIRAPSGGNTQPWHFIAITDPELIEKVGGLYRDLWLGRPGRGTKTRRTPSLPAGPAAGQHNAGSSGDDTGLRRPFEGLGSLHSGSAHRAGALRLLHLAGDPEPFPGCARAGPGHPHHHGAYPGRRADQGVAEYSRACGDSVPDAPWLSTRQLRADAAPAGGGSQLIQPVRKPLAPAETTQTPGDGHRRRGGLNTQQ